MTGNGPPILVKKILHGFLGLFGFLLKLVPLTKCVGIGVKIAVAIERFVFKVVQLFTLIFVILLQKGLTGTNGVVITQAAAVNASGGAKLLLLCIPFHCCPKQNVHRQIVTL